MSGQSMAISCFITEVTFWRQRLMAHAMLLWLALAVAAIPASPAVAQSPQPNITAALIAENSEPRPGTTTGIAISMTPASGWHGYWLNGGDAGFGMQVRWTLPRGVTIGDLAYPTPDTLIVGGLMNHVYERPYALIAPLTIARDVAPGTRLTITGEAQWLACTDEICVPERGTLTADLTVGAGGTATASSEFAAWRAAIPPAIDQPARYEREGTMLRIAIPLPATVTPTAPHLFLETPRLNEPGGAQRFLRSRHWLVIETPVGTDTPDDAGINGVLRLQSGRGLAFTALPGGVPSGSQVIATVPAASEGGAATAETGSTQTGGGFDMALFLTALAGAIIGGLILNIMPCVFPILSLKALSLARAGGDERAARTEGFAYTAGAVMTCAALGLVLLGLRASGEAVGWAFQLQRPESVMLLIVLMGAITANLAGLFEFGGISFSRSGNSGAAGPAREGFMTGALAAFIATPCTGPFLGAALGATLTLPAWAALPVFGGLGLGLALPFLAIALFPALRARLPKPGPWMATFRRWLALPMALTALALVWLLGRQVGPTGWLIGAATLAVVLALGWWAGSLQRRGEHIGPAILTMVALIVPLSLLLPAPAVRDSETAIASLHGAKPWSAASLATARARGGRVFVYFTADWCVTCKVNEAAAIDRQDTARALAHGGVAVLMADWTNADPAITAELARHGRNSVPLYLWYPAGGGAPEILPQILTPAMLIERAAVTNERQP
jgi:thiol:disulfide interchange protein/DsbC/DsbD-like thiol-disulfide interchange protein